MNEKKKVSVIIPTFQRCESVKRLLESFRRQTFPSSDYEVIICIDGSNDGTKEMLEATRADYDLRWDWSPNSGRSAARNSGIRMALGDVLVFLDDDMELSPGFLEAHYNSHGHRDRIVILGAAPITVNKDSLPVARYVGTKFNSHIEKLSEPGYKIKIWDFYSGNFSIRRENIVEAGLFSEDFVIYGNEDVELASRLQKSGIDIIYNPNALCIQYYEKSFQELAKDTIATGKTAVLLYSEHPDTLNKLKLREYNHAGWKWRALRLLLIKCALLIPKTNDIIISMVDLSEKRKSKYIWKFYDLSLDYFFWFGAFSEIKENGNYSLLSKIKSCRWRPT